MPLSTIVPGTKLKCDLNTEELPVSFHYDIEKFRLRDGKVIRKVISRIISDAGARGGKTDIILTNDQKVYEINSEFLGHDYFTDIITFNYNKGKIISGEIYISVDRVKDNAEKFSVPFKSEVRRVIFHGFLHLCGYDDSTGEQKVKMSEMEEMYLALSYAE
jgi:probable rRNA maturation factor